jgi:ABC-type nitrate/sulfonate/bicarbonate transport system ATPase subunit
MKQISSYVMQDDQLFPMLTVLETLRFAAEVRLPPSLSREEKLKRVWELIEQLGLQVTPLSIPLCSSSRFLLFKQNTNTMNYETFT